MAIQVRKVSYPLGAQVTGVDIRQPLDRATVDAIQRAFLEHSLLLFRGMPLAPSQFVAFSRYFGEPDAHRRTCDPQYPEITRLINKPKRDGAVADAHYAGSDWHADASFRVAPTPVTMLRAVEVPDVGGDTMFANMYLAYDTLSAGMKQLLEKLKGVHVQEEKLLDHSTAERLRESRRSMTIAHPLVLVHPQTGRKSLYFGDKVQMFAGMTPEESTPLIDFLRAHTQRSQFTYGHRWQKNDLVMWDNRCTNHKAMGNYDRLHQPRHMEKISLIGLQTGAVYDDPAQTRNLARSFAYA